jgi:hypothetical protein
MIRPDDKAMQALANVSRQFPEVREWLKMWYEHELSKLPLAVNNPAVPQGRCQVLGEVYNLVKDAPDFVAAKSK